MPDLEKGLDTTRGYIDGQSRDMSAQSPVSDRSSRDIEKMEKEDLEKGEVEDQHATEPEVENNPEDKTPQGTIAQSVIVDWDGPDDPEHPQNFPRWRKFLITISLAGTTLTVTFSSSVYSAATVQTAKEFGVSTEVMILATSLFVLGLGIGPTFFGPLSELYGRKIPLFVGFFIFAIFQIPVAVAHNLQSVLIFRFLQGFMGSSPTATIGGILADIWNARERGFAMPSFAGALFAGPIFGPILGAYISESFLRWRWTQWITLIMAAFFGTIAFINAPETFYPVLLARKAKRLRHETGNWALHAKHEETVVDLKSIGNRYLARPAKMFLMEPILTMITIYLGFVYGVVYLFFEAYPISFAEDRGWSPGIASLPFISILIGVLFGCALMAFTTKTRLAPDPKNGRPVETRLLLMILAACVLPIGLFWFGWTSYPSISPWPQIIAGVPMGFAVIMLTLQGMNYVIDCYTMYANSAMAALTFVRSFFGAGFPLFATYMFRNLGVPWACSVLAFIAIALLPVPVLFFKFGAKIRTWSRYVPTA